MQYTTLLKRAVLAGFVLSSALLVNAQSGSAKKPNVLFIIADDYNGKSPVNGTDIVLTPNLEKLAARGVAFERAYCQYPLCNPSRSSFLSGKRPEHTGIFENNSRPRSKDLKDAVLLPQHFRQNGYYVAGIGKIFHASRYIKDGIPVDDYNTDTSLWSYQYNELVDVKDPEVIRLAHNSETSNARKGAEVWAALNVEDDETGDGLVAKRTIEVLEQQSKSGQPFFIAAGFRRPHAPYDAPKKYFDLYKNAPIKVPYAPANDRDDIPAIALTKSELAGASEKDITDVIRGYYASITFMDAQVGRLLDALKRLNLLENTIVVFMGDHGYHNGEHQGLWHKMTVFEEGTHSTVIVSAPGKSKGAKTNGFIEYVDIFPTLTELTGLAKPAGLDGQSFVSLLNNPAGKGKDAVFTEVIHDKVKGRSVRTAQYRYTEWENGEAELYDHQKDPQEFTNLAKDASKASVITQLKGLLQKNYKTYNSNSTAQK